MIGYHVNSGSISDPIVSHSGANTIDPEIGGHPLDFIAFIQRSEDDIKYTPSLERGDLLHTWLERQSDFVIAELAKPSGQMAEFAEEFKKLYCDKQYEITNGFAEFAQGKLSIEADSLILVNKIYDELNTSALKTNEEVQLLLTCILFARTKAEVNKKLLIPTVIEKFAQECIAYIKFLKLANGKYIMDVPTKNIVVNCHSSIQRHPFAKQFLSNEYHAEKEIYWEEVWNDNDRITIKRKAKLDRFKYFPEEHRLVIVDFKTTAKPVSNFNKGSYESYKYDRQLYNYFIAVVHELHLSTVNLKVELYNVVVQTNGNFPTMVYRTHITDKIRTNYGDLMTRIAYHIKNNVWEITMEEHQQGYVNI